MTKKIVCLICFFLMVFQINLDILYADEPQEPAGIPNSFIKNDPGFILGPDDVLEISAWKDDSLTKKVVVRPDGKISFPLIGDIQAQGKTVEELRKVVENKIRVFVPDTPVSVVVVTVRSPKVYIVGKVNKPGTYIMVENLRVMQALSVAGGMTPFADMGDILIIRNQNGHQKSFKFDYSKVAKGKNLDQNISLKPGDTIVVP
jgi:polysaccharide biosynthesis/export protein